MHCPIAPWLDERLGLRDIYDRTLARKVPRVNWAFTIGSASLFLVITQALTGALLTIYYVPHPEQAYDSVSFIMTDVAFGWLIRGVHHWGASLLIVTLALHMVRIVYHGAYKYPRELTWVTGVLLLLVTLGMAFTGYLLPWNQRAYWATAVGTSLAETVPVFGAFAANVLRGGPELSTLTLVRFFAGHCWVLPAALALLVSVHLYLVIRLGIGGVPGEDE